MSGSRKNMRVILTGIFGIAMLLALQMAISSMCPELRKR